MLFDRIHVPCLLCGARARARLPLCEPCLAALPRLQNPCPRCALEHRGPTGSLCGRCLGSPPLFQHCIAALGYEFPLRQLIGRYKYQQQWLFGPLFQQLLWHRFSEALSLATPPEALIAVPLHPQRLRERGFNQALELARFLSRRSGIPLLHPLVNRQRHTPHQQGLSLKERHRNLKGAFHLEPPLPARHLMLVDDVVTSGATVNEITRLLLRKGANRVDVCCLARTGSPTAG
ncbi:ComF family protein [Aestuariirhabdus litorea]|uniref:ComF family protein n=1 Tax=Aestuariirhabdus litorea TaxID=2528527 RepID=A0A3P3VL88_9GAMM|nr:ComF family protein [Aestuariirhabdus litorea]RRJ83164.1 ComF family protein [Aestuariirhabdus litorea]RWW93321.1 ComF family protein [Endozoicomonadaceae bacterium GTF-13]